jgi:hypothetical protein
LEKERKKKGDVKDQKGDGHLFPSTGGEKMAAPFLQVEPSVSFQYPPAFSVPKR